jgi:predicted nucleotidyltransferase
VAKPTIQQPRIPIGIIKCLRAFFKDKDDAYLVFLFGSFVSKQITANSDIDIGILFNKIPDIYEINDIKEDLSALLKRAADVVVLNNASPILRMQVIKNGVLVIQKNRNVFSLFYGDTVKQYDDLKIIRRKCEENILKGRIYA